MTRTERRSYYRLTVPSSVFAGQMEFTGHTVTTLYETIDLALRKAKVSPRPAFCRSTIGHLRSGQRVNVSSPTVAREIEKALQVRPGSFFTAQLSNLATNVRQAS